MAKSKLQCLNCDATVSYMDATAYLTISMRVKYGRSGVVSEAHNIMISSDGDVMDPNELEVTCPNCGGKGMFKNMAESTTICDRCHNKLDGTNDYCEYHGYDLCYDCWKGKVRSQYCSMCAMSKAGCELYKKSMSKHKKGRRRK